jgi:hypothetical protein
MVWRIERRSWLEFSLKDESFAFLGNIWAFAVTRLAEMATMQ